MSAATRESVSATSAESPQATRRDNPPAATNPTLFPHKPEVIVVPPFNRDGTVPERHLGTQSPSDKEVSFYAERDAGI